MIDNISTFLLDRVLYKGESIVGDQREIMKFGITRVVEDIPKYIVIILLSITLNVLPQVGIVLLTTICYKTFVGGVHARTNMVCLVMTTLIFIGPALCAKLIEIPQNIVLLLYIALIASAIYVIAKIVPADTEEIPILNKKKRKKLKIQAAISFSILLIIATIIPDVTMKMTILISMLLINIMATKMAYKLLKCKYSYESEEFKEYFEQN